MKKIFSMSSVFIGLVIGAGFASGREIFVFFNIPSSVDFTGIVIATISFGAICYIITHLSQKYKSPNFDSLIQSISGKPAPLIKLFMTAFMFSGFFIMLSACGVLATESLGISKHWGICGLAFICFCIFAFDIKGLVTINVILVPLMTIGMIFICLSSMYSATPTFAALDSLKTNPIVSSICYVSYNTVTAGAVLVPLSHSMSKKHLLTASVISGGILGFLIYIAWLSMSLSYTHLLSVEMPLLALASDTGQLASFIYTTVLFMALCTTAISHGFGVLSKFSFSKMSHRIMAAAILCLSAIPFASLGFSSLISNLYSAFGYLGLVWTAVMIWKFIKS